MHIEAFASFYYTILKSPVFIIQASSCSTTKIINAFE